MGQMFNNAAYLARAHSILVRDRGGSAGTEGAALHLENFNSGVAIASAIRAVQDIWANQNVFA